MKKKRHEKDFACNFFVWSRDEYIIVSLGAKRAVSLYLSFIINQV